MQSCMYPTKNDLGSPESANILSVITSSVLNFLSDTALISVELHVTVVPNSPIGTS